MNHLTSPENASFMRDACKACHLETAENYFPGVGGALKIKNTTIYKQARACMPVGSALKEAEAGGFPIQPLSVVAHPFNPSTLAVEEGRQTGQTDTQTHRDLLCNM